MADVRALLRNERAARRILDPLAVYSNSGTLSCRLCAEQIKSEGLWNKHLRSDRHLKIARERASQEAPRKRTAEDSFDDVEMSVRKRVRTPLVDAEVEGLEFEPDLNEPIPEQVDEPEVAPSSPQPDASRGVVDEDEWAAFEREVLNDAPQPSVLTAAPTISAAAISAAELEALESEPVPRNAIRAMEAELAAEKEDASRQIEDEFETMESLEERLAALKGRREAVRIAEEAAITKKENTEAIVNAESDESDEEDEADDEWDSWRIRAV